MGANPLNQILKPVPAPLRAQIEGDILAEIQRAVKAERSRCAAACAERADLWRRTLAAQPGAPRIGVEEARARSNEAQYLADVFTLEPGVAQAATA